MRDESDLTVVLTKQWKFSLTEMNVFVGGSQAYIEMICQHVKIQIEDDNSQGFFSRSRTEIHRYWDEKLGAKQLIEAFACEPTQEILGKLKPGDQLYFVAELYIPPEPISSSPYWFPDEELPGKYIMLPDGRIGLS
jgi:hypothetical protein